MPKASDKKKIVEVKKKAPVKSVTKKAATFAKPTLKPTTKPIVKQSNRPSPLTKAEQTAVLPAEKSPSGNRSVKIHKSTLILAAAIILIGVLLYFGRGYIVAAVVNGQPIYRATLVQESEKARGKQIMVSLIRNALVEQEAGKKNITVNDKEINDQIKTIEDNLSKQGQKLDQVLTLDGMTRDDLKKIFRFEILVTKLVGKEIKISDKDIDNFITENKDILPKGKNDEELKQFAKDQLQKSQLPQKFQAWIAELEKKAKITKFVDY